jgi:ubiquinone/menaquinone biosynthesis C-methylase UbiE
MGSNEHKSPICIPKQFLQNPAWQVSPKSSLSITNGANPSEVDKMSDTQISRSEIEKQFHDAKATISVKGNPFYSLGILDKADEYAYSLLGDLAGKMALEIGCGMGEHTIRLAKRGAQVYAIDISPEMVEQSRQRVKEEGLGNQVIVLEMNAEEMEFVEGTFDAVFGHSVLHHTDLSLTRGEVYRVLKKGGTGVFVEPLGHNPLVNLFRRLTPHWRTPTERPFNWDTLLFWGQLFSSFTHREFYLIALAAVVLFPFRNRKLSFRAI